MYYTSKHHMIALFGEMNDIFSFNLDRLHLKKSLKLFFKLFSCLQNYKIVQPSAEESVYKTFSLISW